MNKTARGIALAALFALSLAFSVSAQAQAMLKPYILASNQAGDYDKIVADTKAKLAAAGFEIVGAYAPVPEATVIAITNDELKQAAASSNFGGYLAGMRVAVTRQWGSGKGKAFTPSAQDPVQVSFTDPVYWAAAYRVKADLAPVRDKLVAALGDAQDFGTFGSYEKGVGAAELSKYHYTVMMEYFDNYIVLGSFPDHAAALKAVDAGLAARAGGVSQVYRIDIPGKDETVYGVALAQGDAADSHIMKTVDKGPLHEAAYAPYEILVSSNRVLTLHPRFRIAIAYLGLPMAASSTSGTFLDIMSAPGAIEGALRKVVAKN